MSHDLIQYIGQGTKVGDKAGIMHGGRRIGEAEWTTVSSMTIGIHAKGRFMGQDFDEKVEVALLGGGRGRVTISSLGSREGDVRTDRNAWLYVDHLGFPRRSPNAVALQQQDTKTGISAYVVLAWATAVLDPAQAGKAELAADDGTPDVPSAA